MVTITDYKPRQAENGDPFFVLILQGGIEMVQSKETKRFYATAKKCSIPSTFTEAVCQGMIGTQISGKVTKVACEPYEYAIPDTGEVIDLTHRWEYQPDSTDAESTNGVTPEQLMKDLANKEVLESI
jgi:hypothetical protein